MSKQLKAVGIICGFLISATSHGRPPTKGVDFDEDSIAVTKGSTVAIEGQVTTTNTQSGNKSSVILYVNGVEKKRAGGEQANSTVRYTISQEGDYDLKIVCDNERADADTCVLTVNKKERKKY